MGDPAYFPLQWSSNEDQVNGYSIVLTAQNPNMHIDLQTSSNTRLGTAKLEKESRLPTLRL
jgi:hypothetical protein